MSSQRMERYLIACGGNTRKSMTLYRYNLQVSQEMVTIVSCFEVALRNAIDRKLTKNLGDDWLRDSITKGGIFTRPILKKLTTSLHMLIRSCSNPTPILTQSYWRRWNLAFGNTCSPLFNIVSLDAICFPFSKQATFIKGNAI